MFFYDWTYILVIIGALLSMLAQAKVNSTFNRYSRIGSRSGMTGAEAAGKLLNRDRIGAIALRRVHGHHHDNYNTAT